MATVEQYSPDNDQCAFLMSVLQPVSLTGTAAFHGNIFVAGEYSVKRGNKFVEIQRFHLKMKQWSIVGNLPIATMRLAACSSR